MHLRHQQKKLNKMSTKLGTAMGFIFFLIQFLVKTIDAGSCDILFPKENDLTMVISIDQGSDLTNYLSGIYNKFNEQFYILKSNNRK